MIRKYQPQDLEHIMKIWLETNLAAHRFIPAEYWNGQYEAVKEALPQADILIYEEEGTVLGFLGLQDSYIAGLLWKKHLGPGGLAACFWKLLNRDGRN